MEDLNSFQLDLGQPAEIGMMLILSLMMFSVALGLRVEHFNFFRTKPKIYFAGVIAQIIGLPLLTLGLCYLLNPLPAVALGMILIACCPGGNVSNLLVVLARGNAALSVSLTATSSFAAAFITPVAILFWSSLYSPTDNLLNEIAFDAYSFLLQTSLILIVPLIGGMLLAVVQPSLANKLRYPLVLIASAGLLLIVVGALVKYFDQFLTIGFSLLGIVVLHNACSFLLGFITARVIDADQASTRSLTFEVGIQNAGLGIVILLTQLSNLGGAAVIAGLWGTWHIVAGLILVGWFRRNGGVTLET